MELLLQIGKRAGTENGERMSSILDQVVLLLQRQQDEIKALLLAHKREIVEFITKHGEK